MSIHGIPDWNQNWSFDIMNWLSIHGSQEICNIISFAENISHKKHVPVHNLDIHCLFYCYDSKHFFRTESTMMNILNLMLVFGRGQYQLESDNNSADTWWADRRVLAWDWLSLSRQVTPDNFMVKANWIHKHYPHLYNVSTVKTLTFWCLTRLSLGWGLVPIRNSDLET